MKITGTINFELDDKDLKKSDVEVDDVMPEMPLPPGLDDVARARMEKQLSGLRAASIRQRISKLEKNMAIANAGFAMLMNLFDHKLSELKSQLIEVEGTPAA